MFKKILIANRGEIAVRIIRACKSLGICSVAIRSISDSESLHSNLADESYCIGAADVEDSYMNIDSIICTAILCGADAIHPGYGFLAESFEFARRCEENGIAFIGPDSDKLESILSEEVIRNTLEELNIPISEAKLKSSPKKIDIQFMRDQNGRIVVLGDRDSSFGILGKRHIGEMPSPMISEKTRKRLIRCAEALTEKVDYVGIGNIVFFVDTKGNYCFHRFIPRLQKGCAIAEMHTRIDMVQWQIRIAAGEAIDFPDSAVGTGGCTVGCRIMSSFPQNMVPSAGRVNILHIPGGMDVSFDTAVFQGCRIPTEYEPLLGKMVVHAMTREDAIRKLDAALSELIIDGAYNNREFLRSLINSEIFLSGEYTVDSSSEIVDK